MSSNNRFCDLCTRFDSMRASCCVGPGLWTNSSAKGLMAEDTPWGSYHGASGCSQQAHGTWQPEAWWQPEARWQPGKGWSGAAWEERQVRRLPQATASFFPQWAPDRDSGMHHGWGLEEHRSCRQSQWVQALQAELDRLSTSTAQPVTMATFAQSLQDVLTSLTQILTDATRRSLNHATPGRLAASVQ